MCYLGWDADRPCGIAAGCPDRDHATTAHLVSMWVAPSHRRLGVGRLFVDGILGWGRGQGTEVVGLTVTSNNDAARHFYEPMGFTLPGMAAQYRHDLALLELGMQRPSGQSGARPAGCHGIAPSGSRGAGARGAVPRPMPAGPARERSPTTGFEPASPSLPGCSSPTSRVVASECVYAKVGMNTMLRSGIVVLALTAVISVVTASALTQQPTATTIAHILNDPVHDHVVTLSGQLVHHIEDNAYLLDDGTGQTVIDGGPAWYHQLALPLGENVTITGKVSLGPPWFAEPRPPEIDVFAVALADGTVIDVRGPGRAPWAGGPPWAGDRRWADGRDGGPPPWVRRP